MRMLSLLLALAALLLYGCDSGGGGSAFCDDFSFRSGGTLTATVDGESVQFSCYNAFTENGLTYITGYEPGASAFELRSQATLVIGGTAAGAYAIEGDDPTDVSTAQYASGNEGSSRAESGAIQVSAYSETRLRGTFRFVTESGVRVSNGVFDLDVSGLL